MADGDFGHTGSLWAVRASLAEKAVRTRHLRRLWGIPGTRLGVIRWPATLGSRLHLPVWHYWWQAHLLDCLVDAQCRAPDLERKAVIGALLRGIKMRNGFRWTNRYYDDMAWLALAMQRSSAYAQVSRAHAVEVIVDRLRHAWTDHGGGGIWWRRRDDYKNVPTNGPAAMVFANLADDDDQSDLHRAMSLVDWIEEWLVDQDKGLVLDGLRANKDGDVYEVSTAVYSYCQGVFLGACIDLAEKDTSTLWPQLAKRTVLATSKYLVGDNGVLYGHDGGDGGLFTGILVRYLAQAALRLTDTDAAQLVYRSAESAWQQRTAGRGYPLFGAQWAEKANTARKNTPERDLSVQLSGWMLLEAAALLERNGIG